MNFNYYYGAQADLFSFIRIPRAMLTDSAFSSLSLQAKVLYAVLLDRMSLSRKNGWFDEENRVFIIYQIGEIQNDLGFSKKKAMDLLTELEDFGLLEKKRRGHGLPNILYVKSFMAGNDAGGVGNDTSTGSGNSAGEVSGGFRGAGNNTPAGSGRPGSEFPAGSNGSENIISAGSRSVGIGTSTGSRGNGLGTLEGSKPTLQEVSKPALLRVSKLALLMSKTDINNTYMSQTESDHIVSSSCTSPESDDAMRSDQDPADMDTAAAYEQLIRSNIAFDDLLMAHAEDRDLICGIADLILETVISRQEYIVISSSRFPAEIVRSRFLKLNYLHIDYVLACLHKNTSKVGNIKKYLLAVLFNAPSTMDGYYRAEVNFGMAHMTETG